MYFTGARLQLKNCEAGVLMRRQPVPHCARNAETRIQPLEVTETRHERGFEITDLVNHQWNGLFVRAGHAQQYSHWERHLQMNEELRKLFHTDETDSLLGGRGGTGSGRTVARSLRAA
jgi:hypothetical protein